MAAVTRVFVLLWVDILAMYAMYVMMEYLTNVWKIGFTHAAAIVNIFWGVVAVSPLFLRFIVDILLGNYWMLLLSTISYSVGLGFVAMSTPPVLAKAMGTCREYKPECIGEGQKILFYTGLPLVAFGMSGHLASWNSFMVEQQDDSDGTFWRGFCSIIATNIFSFVAVLGLPYIKPWSVRFGIPAICTLVATLLFLSGSRSYNYFRPGGSPLIIFIRVFVASLTKVFHTTPRDAKELFELEHPLLFTLPHTKSLRCLDKAAIVVPTKPLQEQVPWRLCRVTEVEETKTIIRMIPVWTTFVLCGVVSAVGFTYFIIQLDRLNHKVGRLKLPSVALLWVYEQAQNQCTKLYAKLANSLARSGSRKYGPPLGIAISMILAILCCITAAKVEDRRLGVVREHGLVDKPDEIVPMTMFWMLPQFVLLGAFNGIFSYSAISLFVDQAPVHTQSYMPFFISAVTSVGIFGSVLSVFVVGKVSEKGGKTNWFQHDLNASRLDKYYLTLAWLMAVNLVVFVVVAILYRYKESRLQDQEGAEFGGLNAAYDEDTKHWLFCCC